MPLATRSTSGCYTCRRRHKKCDEVRPICAGCDRNKLICSWPFPTFLKAAPSSVDGLRKKPERDAMPCPLPPGVSGLGVPPVFRATRNRELLQNYAVVTSHYLAARACPVNPYLRYNIQLAWGCVELQHVLLALSCCQLAGNTSPALARESMTHYLVALRGLKHAVTGWWSASPSGRVSILATTLALCQFEVISANNEGSLYHHMRASRWMILQLRENLESRFRDFLGFFEEQYLYLAIVAHSSCGSKSALVTWSHEERSAAQSLRDLNHGSSIYGFMFGAAHELFQLIPQIHSLALRCASQKLQQCPDLEARYADLKYCIDCARVEVSISDRDSQATHAIYQNAISIYLHLAFHGGGPPTRSLRSSVKPLVENYLDQLESLPSDSKSWTTGMWPALIIGSCMISQCHRNRLLDSLRTIEIELPVIQRILWALPLYWQALDEGQTMFGPNGLETTLLERGVVLCIG